MGKDIKNKKKGDKGSKGGKGHNKSGLKGKKDGVKMDKNSKAKTLLKNAFSSSRQKHDKKVDALRRGKTARVFDTGMYTKGRCLVIGDGDLTFSVALSKNIGNRTMLATTFDSKEQVLEKYPTTQGSLAVLKDRNVPVLHGIDGTALSKHFPSTLRAKYSKGKMLQLLEKGVSEEELSSGFRNYPFDTIIFNFPHSGAQRVHVNQELLRKFFISCRPHLCADEERPGKVMVTLKKGSPYDGWHIEEQAASGLFQLEKKFPFDFKAFPGYSHVTTNPEHNQVEEDSCQVYVFKLSAVGRLVAKQENVVLQKDFKQLPVPKLKEKIVATVDRSSGLDDVKNRLGSLGQSIDDVSSNTFSQEDSNADKYKNMFANFSVDMLDSFQEKKQEEVKKDKKKKEKKEVVQEQQPAEELKKDKKKKEKKEEVEQQPAEELKKDKKKKSKVVEEEELADVDVKKDKKKKSKEIDEQVSVKNTKKQKKE